MRTQFGKSVLKYLGCKSVQNTENTEGAQVCKTQPSPNRAVVTCCMSSALQRQYLLTCKVSGYCL